MCKLHVGPAAVPVRMSASAMSYSWMWFWCTVEAGRLSWQTASGVGRYRGQPMAAAAVTMDSSCCVRQSEIPIPSGAFL